MNNEFDSSNDMLSWQLKTLLGQIQQIELHETGDCPCILNTEEPPERCLGKLYSISAHSVKRRQVWIVEIRSGYSTGEGS